MNLALLASNSSTQIISIFVGFGIPIVVGIAIAVRLLRASARRKAVREARNVASIFISAASVKSTAFGWTPSGSEDILEVTSGPSDSLIADPGSPQTRVDEMQAPQPDSAPLPDGNETEV